jgi:hypothetical protein
VSNRPQERRVPPDLVPRDADLVAHLKSVAPEHWDEIWQALADVLAEDVHLDWEGGGQVDVRVIDGEERPVFQMPYPVYSPAVDRLRTALGVLVVPFAWPQWDGVQRYRAGRGMADAPVADAVRMITAVLRSERFTDGSIAGAIDDDTLPAAVRRLRSWYDARGG